MNRWLSALFFVGGIGPFNYFLGDLLLPYLDAYFHFEPSVYRAVYFPSCILSAIAHYFSPYCFHMFALAFSGVFAKVRLATRRLIYAAALVPVAVMFVVIPVYPHEPIHFVYLLIWMAPTGIAAGILMTVSFLKERISSKNYFRLLVWLLTVPLAFAGLYTSYITRALGYTQVYKVTIWIPIILFVVVIIFLFKFGLWGIRLRIERQLVTSSIKGVNIGIQTLIHAIKNELAKVSISVTNTRNALARLGRAHEPFDRDLHATCVSIESLYNIVNKIKEQSTGIELHEEVIRLHDYVDRAIAMNDVIVRSRNVSCINQVPSNIRICFDPFHIQETLNNLISNALDAMENGGTIKVSFRKNGLLIHDDGKGIKPEDLKSVFNPFFSTSTNQHSFGLGLTYCFIVMERHGGRIDIASREGEGTTVTLRFNRTKVLGAQPEGSGERDPGRAAKDSELF